MVKDLIQYNMDIHFDQLQYSFQNKPLLIGGKAMEYYGLRKAGADIDLVASETDIVSLIKVYPNRVKLLWSDLGVCPLDFEIWKTICSFDYDYLKKDAIETENVLIISSENLLFTKALAYKKEKYLNDVKLIVEYILKNQGKKFPEINKQNQNILSKIPNITFIEKTGP